MFFFVHYNSPTLTSVKLFSKHRFLNELISSYIFGNKFIFLRPLMYIYAIIQIIKFTKWSIWVQVVLYDLRKRLFSNKYVIIIFKLYIFIINCICLLNSLWHVQKASYKYSIVKYPIVSNLIIGRNNNNYIFINSIIR